jgi:hypothetical protein
MSLITFALCTGGFLWYRRVYRKLSWREVFFLEKEDDGRDAVVDLDDEDEDDDDPKSRKLKNTP